METAPAASRPVAVQRHSSNSSSASSSSQPPLHPPSTGSAAANMAHALTLAMCSVRSMSVASISSEGSTESHGHGVEQEEIAALTHDVRNFKEALGHLRRIFQADREFAETIRVTAHERLGEVLRILRTVLEKHPALQYNELLMAAGSLIQHVKGYDYEDEKANPKDFFESIDQLAFAFSRRVSEYLMGDLDASASLSSSVSSKTKSYETLAARPPSSRGGWGRSGGDCEGGGLSEQPDSELLRTEQAVEALLRRAKFCSKYLKDVITYAEKRAHLDLEYAKNLAKLAQTVRPLISEEIQLPLQSTYCTALDHDISNCNSFQATNSLILGGKYLEPMNARRSEHERRRKQLKEHWQREIKRTQEAEAAKRKAYALFVQRQQAVRVAECAENASGSAVASSGRPDKRRKAEDEAVQKAFEAEGAYKVACIEVDERALQLQRVKAEILHSLQALLLQYDQTLKAATMNYFQLQHAMSSLAPTQFQTLYENSCLYEPGLQYHDFVKRFCALASQKHALETSSSFSGDKEPRSIDSSLENDFSLNPQGPEGTKVFSKKAWSSSSHHHQASSGGGLGSDTDSSHSTKSREPSPTNVPTRQSSGDELDNKPEPEIQAPPPAAASVTGMSRASISHKFRTFIGANYRCQECDTKIYLHALECIECGLICHKECMKTLTIQCGPTRLPEKLSVFGVDLAQHLQETNTIVPHILTKCIQEIDENGLTIKGIYRISGVKSKVEKLCQDFETGADRVDLGGMNAHVIASVLKLYLRQLPEPLLTFKLYPNFVKVARDWPTTETTENVDLSELKDLIQSLPPHHRNSLHLLMQHLQRVACLSEVNSMPPSNLGIVFGPTLLRTPEGSASLSCLVDTVHQTKAIELLIVHTTRLFSSAPPKIIATSSTLSESQQSSLEIVLPGFISETLDMEPRRSSQVDDAILGFVSDEELLPESLLPDCSPAIPTSPLLRRNSSQQSKAPVIFKTTLRDYKGLEGADSDSLILNLPESTTENICTSQSKTKKSIKAPEEAPIKSIIDQKQRVVESDFESHLLEDDQEEIPKSFSEKSIEESQSEGDESGTTNLRRAATLPTAHIKPATQEDEAKSSSSTSGSIMHSTKHHFSVVTSHFVGRRSSSMRATAGETTTRTESSASKSTRDERKVQTKPNKCNSNKP